VGFAIGRSAAHILAATGKAHVAIDPFQRNYRDIGRHNMSALGLMDRLELLEEMSHAALPRLLDERRSFDFIFIDGCHRFDGIFVDFYYADLLLQQGGSIVFHDTWMRSTQLVVSFVRKNRCDYRVVEPPGLINMCVIQKVGSDARDGMHFAEFYTWRSWFRHGVGSWLASPPRSRLKQALLWAKGKLRG
jgi:hypothetical protein